MTAHDISVLNKLTKLLDEQSAVIKQLNHTCFEYRTIAEQQSTVIKQLEKLRQLECNQAYVRSLN